MTNPPPTPFDRLRFHLGPIPDPSATDAELVARFVATRDDSAFAELVRRHGPLVLAVCRRVTGNRDDADDAFQASFLVLARKPDRVRPDSPLAAWLYGVAVRAARKAVARTAKRRDRETTGDVPDVPAQSAQSDPETVRAVLEEVARLSNSYRAAVVLCELEGRSRSAAARELGIAEGTLSSRLASARKALARRLRDRGLAPAVLAAVGGSAACPVLAADALRLGRASASPVPRVEQLSEAVMKTSFPVRWVTAAAVVVAVSLGFALGGPDPTPAPKPTAKLQVPAAQPAPAKPLPPGPNKILFYRGGHLTLIDPDGKNEQKVSENRAEFHPGDSKLSPDGKTLATLIQTAEAPKDGRDPQRKLYIRAIGAKEPGTDTGVTCQMFAWSPDGTEIAATDFVDAPGQDDVEPVSSVYNVRSKEKTALKVPAGHIVTDWSRDGKHLVTTVIKRDKRDGPKARIHLVNRDGTEYKAVTNGKGLAAMGRLSPDGRRVLAFIFELPDETPAQKKVRDEQGRGAPRPKQILSLIDVATGKVSKVEDLPLNGDIQGYCWSPDGKKIAYAWRQVHDGDPKDLTQKETESFLVVADPDGKNAKTIATEKGGGQGVITIAHLDWR